MKKYVAYLILAFAVMLVLPSCENRTGIDFAENTLTLTLSCNNLGLTRATIGGEDALNENLVKSIDCYFYAAGADKETAALLVRHNVSVRPGNAVGTYIANISFEEAELTTLFGTVDRNSSATCLIYVIANRPSGLSLPMNGENTTINKLKALTITSDFIKDGAFNKQESFVMDSDGEPNTSNDTSVPGQNNTNIENDDIVTLSVDNTGTKTLSGIVPLYRTAAKVTLSISRFGPKDGNGTVVDNKGTEETTDDIVYMPNYSGIYAVFHNGLNKSHIAPDVVENNFTESESSPYFTTGNFAMVKPRDATSYQLTNPFYSYSYDWKTLGSKEAYITLIVPWGVLQGYDANNNNAPILNDEKEYYYKVPINYDGDELVRNTHYKIDIAVSILGTLDPESTVEITPSYTILDWNSDEVNTSMSDFRYLMVEKNKYVMNNVNEIYIPYWSSHECSNTTITNNGIKAYVVQQDLSDNTPKYESVPTNSYVLELVVINGERYIHYKKDLVNDFNKDNFDFTPYEIALRIYHTSDESHYEEITITQYPAIYGESHSNTDATNGGDDNANKGFVWVNGYQGTTRNTYITSSNNNTVGYFDGAAGNSIFPNRSMLVFTISSVEGTDYVIGDPREMSVDSKFINATHTVNRNEYSIWDKAPAVDETGTRTLQYYYATDVNHERLKSLDDASTTSFYGSDADAAQHERTYNMIAPKFRVSSAYGMLDFNAGVHNYYHYMKKRCASYQEDGYPAGRWRMPTKAEFEFIIYLSAQGKIPELFYDGYYYWCAHGYGIPDLDEKKVEMGYVTLFTPPNNQTRISVRCVYDDWYWGSDRVTDANATNTYQNGRFVWGDILRSEKADAPAIKY